jgi:hypothetical protein
MEALAVYAGTYCKNSRERFLDSGAQIYVLLIGISKVQMQYIAARIVHWIYY